MWQWSESQLSRIDSWKSQSLRDVYFAIYRKFVTETLIKRQLRTFGGLKYTSSAKREHEQTISKELGGNALLRVCEFLDIGVGEYAAKNEMAAKIVDAISFVGSENSDGSNATILEKQLVILEQIEKVDAENVDVKRKVCEQEAKLISMKRILSEVENNATANSDADMANMRDDIGMLQKELDLLQAEEEALISKKNVLKTKAALTESSAGSERSKNSVRHIDHQTQRTSEWVRNQRQENSVDDAQEINDSSDATMTMAKMLARQSFNGKNLEFDGTSALNWRHFISEFKATSAQCGFSKEENVRRLSKALKGAARDKVSLLLISAKDPDKIVSILEKAYGGPENVALELMSKASEVKSVKQLTDFEEYNYSVQNISSALEYTDNMLIDTQRLLATMIGKLSESYLREWGAFLRAENVTASYCTFEKLAEWSQKQADLIQDVSFFKKVMTINQQSSVAEQPSANQVHNQEDEAVNQPKPKFKATCSICSEEKHPLNKCNTFLKADVKKRWDLANRHKACYCCLKFHKGQCNERQACKIDNCEKYHNSLLHKRLLQPNIAPPSNFSGCVSETKTKSLLKLVPIIVHGEKGSKEIVAFLDEGSTSTIMDMSLAREVGIQGDVKPFCFSWTGGVYRYEADAETAKICLSGKNGMKHDLNDVWLIKDLSLPSQQFDYNRLTELVPKNLVDIKKLQDKKPMLLIGQRHANLITTRAVINGDEHRPMLSKTKLGWVIHGPVQTELAAAHFTCCQVNDENLQQMIKHQFSIENFGVCTVKVDKTQSLEDQLAIYKAESSIVKKGNHYEVSLPWKSEDVKLPDSNPMAIQRLKCLERKLLRNKETAQAYQNEIQKLLDKGYAIQLANADVLKSPKLWYLPHFAIINPSKPGKVRLVFDAAAECNGTSLNKNLLTGPDWSTSIVGILIRFRLHRVAVVADIREMFNQVRIADSDAAAQCFLWRNLDQKRQPTVFQMMLFGTTSSPFLAQFVKNYNASKYKEEHPAAVKAILENHYVDDYLDSKPCSSEVINLITTIIQIHSKAGFELRQFISNSDEVMNSIPENLRAANVVAMIGDKTDVQQKVLGMLWDAKGDFFTYSTTTMHKLAGDLLHGNIIPTKRNVLSAVNSLYDPLGLMTPVTIKGRILMRDVWESGIGWDDTIKGDLIAKWQNWRKILNSIEDTKIPRCYSGNLPKADRVEIHIFNDASAKAYSSAAYIRCCYRTDDQWQYDVALVASKAKVSPIKHITIPKLETMAAVLGCRLAEMVQAELQIKLDERYFWTDSRTVLAWINSDKRMEVFVANRIGEICEKSTRAEWRWLSTNENIADVITRDNIPMHKLQWWLTGPEFLKKPESMWENPKFAAEYCDQTEIVMTLQQTEHPLNVLLQRISTYNKLIRSTAWIQRFIVNLSTHTLSQRKTGKLNVDEIEWAEKMWCKVVQQQSFPDDLIKLQTGKPSSKLRLSKYCIYLDADNILRVDSRIERAKDLSAYTKKPIILDGKHTYTRMLINKMHVEAQHIGTQVVVHRFKTAYWMPKLNRIIRTTLNACVWCKRKKAKPQAPKMGLLPEERFLTQEKPFTATGVDYFGPFFIKDGKGTRASKNFRKRYGVIFTCLTTRAINVEIAHSLDTDSCILAIRRMMARRGPVKIIWSDNGTNFRGAARELQVALEELDESYIKTYLANNKITWNFIPANAPNFGGCWERLVGCFKRAIEAVLSVNANPNDETLRTIFMEAEYLVNSRPYVLESDDADDEIGLCPNDICVPQSCAIHSPGKFISNTGEKRVWRISQYLVDAFWKRFIKEYLPTLIHRSKWRQDVDNFKVGEIVVMKDNTPRGEWPLGRVMKVYPGEDGVVRVVELKTAKNTYRRPANRLCRIGVQRYDKDDRAETESALGAAVCRSLNETNA
ncbi:hypothetical protein ACLKA6_009799 [Drosophila palustris]